MMDVKNDVTPNVIELTNRKRGGTRNGSIEVTCVATSYLHRLLYCRLTGSATTG